MRGRRSDPDRGWTRPRNAFCVESLLACDVDDDAAKQDELMHHGTDVEALTRSRHAVLSRDASPQRPTAANWSLIRLQERRQAEEIVRNGVAQLGFVESPSAVDLFADASDPAPHDILAMALDDLRHAGFCRFVARPFLHWDLLIDGRISCIRNAVCRGFHSARGLLRQRRLVGPFVRGLVISPPRLWDFPPRLPATTYRGGCFGHRS